MKVASISHLAPQTISLEPIIAQGPPTRKQHRARAANPSGWASSDETSYLRWRREDDANGGVFLDLRALADNGQHGVLLATHDLRMASRADCVLSMRVRRIVKETVLQAGRSGREVLAELT